MTNGPSTGSGTWIIRWSKVPEPVEGPTMNNNYEEKKKNMADYLGHRRFGHCRDSHRQVDEISKQGVGDQNPCGGGVYR